MSNNLEIIIKILDYIINYEKEEVSILLEIGNKLRLITKHISEVDYDSADWWKK